MTTEENTTTKPHRIAWRWWLVLLIALAVRGWGLDSQSLTMDEWFELDLAHHPVQRIVSEGDGFPPLYNLTLKAVIGLFGDPAARWLSVAFSMLALPLIMDIGRRLGNQQTGWIAGAIYAVMPISVWHGQQARAYALMILAAAISLWFVVRILDGGSAAKKNWWGLASGLTLGMYSHYFFVFCALYLMSVLVFCLGRQCLRPLAVTGMLVVVACWPWLYFLPPDMAAQLSWPATSGLSVAKLGYTYFSLISGYTLGPSLRELHTLPVTEAFRSVLPWLLTTAVGICLLLAGADAPLRRGRWMIFLLTAPLIVGLTGTISGVGFLSRHVAWCSLPLAVCLALWCSHIRWPRLTGSGGVVLLLLCAVAIFNRQTVDTYRNAAINEVAVWLEQSPPRPTIVVSGYMAPVLGYYLADDWDSDYGPEIERSFSGDWTLWRLGHRSLPDERRARFSLVLNQISPGLDVWLVYSRAFHEDNGGHLLAEFKKRCRGQLVAEFAGARVYGGTSPDVTTSQ